MQYALLHESITDALREVVQACGGPKKVGAMLWPELPIDQAAGKLRDCLNPDRREKLSPEQTVLLARMGREVGCHALMVFMARECGYADPSPIEPEDEVARLQREFVEATKALGALAARIESVQTMSASGLRRVA